MDPVLAQMIASIVTALATVVVAWLGYRSRNRRNGNGHDDD